MVSSPAGLPAAQSGLRCPVNCGNGRRQGAGGLAVHDRAYLLPAKNLNQSHDKCHEIYVTFVVLAVPAWVYSFLLGSG